MALNLKELFQNLNTKLAEKFNALDARIDNIIGGGISADAGNDIVPGTDGLPFYQERTPEDIATDYEGLPNTNKFEDSHKQTIIDFSDRVINSDTALAAKLDKGTYTGTASDLEAAKVDKVPGKGLSPEEYTTDEKTKLAGLESSHFKGTYTSLAELQSVHSTASAGDYADVDSAAGSNVQRYIWDVTDSAWIVQEGSGTTETAASIKTKYESNPDTNAYTDAEKTKVANVPADTNTALAGKVDKVTGKQLSTEDYTTPEKTKLSGIEAGATADQTGAEIVTAVNLQLGSTEWQTQKTLEQIQDIVAAMFQAGTHSNISVAYDDAAGTLNLTGSGGGTGDTTLTDEQVQDIVGAFSTSGSGINVVYDDVNNTMVFSLTGEIFTTAYKNKLDGIEAGANKYIHPATHPATMITEDATHRFATDAEKAAWNAKEKKRTLKAVPNTSQYTLIAADFTDFILDFTANAGENISVILNTGVAPAGGQIQAISSGNNQLVPTAGTGITLKVPSGANAKTTSGGWMSLIPLSAANTFGVNGNLETPDGGSQTYSVFTRTQAGLVPAPGGSGGTEYLREDGLWVTPPNTTYSPFTNTVNGLVPAPNVAGEYNVVIDSPAEGATLTAGQTTTVTGTITQVTSAGKVLKDTGWEDDIHVEDDATFDPTTRAGTNIITYTI